MRYDLRPEGRGGAGVNEVIEANGNAAGVFDADSSNGSRSFTSTAAATALLGRTAALAGARQGQARTDAVPAARDGSLSARGGRLEAG